MRDPEETPREALQRADRGPKPSLPGFSLPSLTVVAWIVLVGVILTVGFIAGFCASQLFETYYTRTP